ncbi:M56 family metallopeptidase [Tepidibacter hydrothermalis]|uniref:M56 family metallopeptidase n=1 Tax=Tepidibacter hydrothermalis TaxID=3036126 RepID=A0ABY8EFE0_9FIRM|nr:M56 family metallopeptidase [Tepidibacter hydrothermalis]WFD10197.1 M56 family metallopeptidase [Tepidibacter hydrothermalis]
MINFTNILFIMSLKTSILILIILTVKFLFNKFFTAQTHYIIWFLLFISLTVPYTVQSNISIYNVPKYFTQNKYISKAQFNYNNSSSNINNYNNFIRYPYLNNNKSISKEKDTTSTTAKENQNTFNIFESLKNIFTYIWLLGFLLLSFIVFIKTIRSNKLIRMEEDILDTQKLSILNNCKELLGIKQNLRLIKTTKFSTPSLVGIFSPRILLPEKILYRFDNEQLELILLHELSHLKRKDILMNWIILIYQLIYWFNPIIWIGFYKMKNDMEVACDAHVLNNLKKEKHIFYGKIIIDLLDYISKPSFIPVSTNILENKYELKRRIVMIKKFKKTSYKLTFISFLLIALVGCSSISEPENNTNPTPNEISEQEPRKTIGQNDEYPLGLPDAKKILNNKNWIIGKDYEFIWKTLGTPYINTYYVNTKGLSSDEILNNLSNETIYPIKSDEDSSALYVFMENDKIVDMKIDEFSGIPSNTWKDSDYKVNFYTSGDIDKKDLPYLEKDSNLSKFKKEFLNKPLSDLKNKFNLTHGASEAFNKKDNLKLTVYPIIGKDITSPFAGIYVLSENNIIKDIKIDRANLQLERLDEHFSLTNKSKRKTKN